MWKALSAISSAITSGAAALETAARGTEQFAKALENEVDELAKSRAIERKRQMDTLNKELEALETATHAGDKSVKRLENEVSMDAKEPVRNFVCEA